VRVIIFLRSTVAVEALMLDVWSAPYYEMAGGRRAFKGDSGVDVMHSILKEEPVSSGF
jgi:hypothetical protein